MTTIITGLSLVSEENIDLNKVTKKIGLTPTRIHRKGEKINNSAVLEKYTAWIYETKEIKSFSAEDRLEALLKVIKPKFDEIVEISTEFNLLVQISIIVYLVNNRTPSINLSSTQIQKIAGINASLDIDIIPLD